MTIIGNLEKITTYISPQFLLNVCICQNIYLILKYIYILKNICYTFTSYIYNDMYIYFTKLEDTYISPDFFT